MGVSFNGTSQSASFPAVFASEYRAITIAYWIRLVPFAVNGGDYCLSEHTANSNGEVGVWFHYRVSDANLSLTLRNSTGYIQDYPTPISGTNGDFYTRWHSVVFVHRIGDASSGQGYNTWFADGRRRPTVRLIGSMSSAADKFKDATTYLMARGGSSLYAQGDMAEYGIAAGEWDQRMALEHARGIPFNKITGCQPLYYFPMREPGSDSRSVVGNKSALMTYAGSPVATDHPRIVQPFRRLRLIADKALPAAGGRIPLVGTGGLVGLRRGLAG